MTPTISARLIRNLNLDLGVHGQDQANFHSNSFMIRHSALRSFSVSRLSVQAMRNSTFDALLILLVPHRPSATGIHQRPLVMGRKHVSIHRSTLKRTCPVNRRRLSLRYLQQAPPLTPERCDQLGNNGLFIGQLGYSKSTAQYG